MPSRSIDFPQGTPELLIHHTLSLQPVDRWSDSERIQQISSGVLGVQRGSLYPACTAGSAAAGSKPDGVHQRAIAEQSSLRLPKPEGANSRSNRTPGKS
jgi:hypothetical protein